MSSENQAGARKVVHVAVAVIRGDDGRILIARRPNDKHMGGYWEFPGGKVEKGEFVTTALNRELKEELNVEADQFRKLISIRHDYPDRSVYLDTWWANDIRGQPRGNEGQEIRWVDLKELPGLNFPPANTPIVSAALLPNRYMITGKFEVAAELLEKVSYQIEEGVELIQFRAPWLDRATYQHLARELHHLCRETGASLLLKGEPELLANGWCDGIHLTSKQLQQEGVEWRSACRSGQWLAASCHNQEQIDRAVSLGVDFVTLSPVMSTETHPGCETLGMEKAAELTERCPLPVFWLGGMQLADQEQLIERGAQGLAAIGAFWSQTY
ncbi:Nudix family hydrolase [Endozoicomonas sp. 8E]|uniref:Nudix family hydrolase n=1 Tax=Endozoicomonas sp. 8E TaxID=3035692 RepID=UPI002938FE0E|nr:Nudix family hydrolase [Endozoicomonas sp. 8E]WOG26164.1 Nudix family hydrolase [Endozoicomonas sp. 8E]